MKRIITCFINFQHIAACIETDDVRLYSRYFLLKLNDFWRCFVFWEHNETFAGCCSRKNVLTSLPLHHITLNITKTCFKARPLDTILPYKTSSIMYCMLLENKCPIVYTTWYYNLSHDKNCQTKHHQTTFGYYSRTIVL